MKKLKIYFDTSVISHLDAHDVPEKMADTHKLWEEIKRKKYDVIISNITIEEIERCDDTKKDILAEYISQIDMLSAKESEESVTLAGEYLRYGALKEKSRDDCRHIGLATVVGADYIVSWNFRHFVNVKTIDKVQAVNKLLGYSEVRIVSPPMLLGGDEDD